MPKFADVLPALSAFVADSIVVHHTHFDRVSVQQACDLASLPMTDWSWLDSAKMARRCWEDVAQRGFGLAKLAERLGIEFQHHDALEDARATGLVVLEILKASGMSLDEWAIRSRQSIVETGRDAIRREGHDDGPLSGEVVVFTGQMKMPRRAAADRAQALGASVDDLLNKRTTLLVVGDQDLSKLAGHAKSSKHRKAESLIAQGHAIRIVAERDFLAF
jgi:DNA polymerase-3 subunit epsilon